ncbi:hypothetical protein [Rhizobium leguminosarum]|uniref:hypothetical protein n=1 Tax=Rhizobium leguminosarum TaxID=384 RepID=UPI0024B3A982|nr:hypothetical protein [Rhizobium leguminosarum]WHO83897.1 hypothetical protein QMO81_006825 [Rhizobium leguminosarum]
MPRRIDYKPQGLKSDHVTLGVLASLIFFAVGPSGVWAQGAVVLPTKAGATTVGERVQGTTEALMQMFDFGADLSSKSLIRILPGDWETLSSESSHGMSASSLKKLCAFNRVHLKQPDPLYPIFDGWIGREGSSRRFELRLSAGASIYWISNVQDQMRALGYDHSEATDVVKIQRSLAIRNSVQQGEAFPVNDDVVGFINSATPTTPTFLVRCPGEPEDTARSERNIQTVNTIAETMAQRASFLSYGSDGSVPFVSKMQGTWTLVDDLGPSGVQNQTVADLCHIRRVEMRADHQPLPILTAHVADTSSEQDRPVPASQDEFELRLAGDGELLRVALHDPLVEVKQDPERFRVPPAEKDDLVAKRHQQAAVAWYRQMTLSLSLPVTLNQIDDDTLIETPKNPWGQSPSYGSGPAAFKRYWLRCPQS